MEKSVVDFIDKIQYIEDFIHLHYGDHNILYMMRKNCNQEMKYINKSLIKSFIVHGMGCMFYFKDSQVDISLLDDKVCFNTWNLSSFLNFRYNENQIKKGSRLVKVYFFLILSLKLNINFDFCNYI